MIALLVLISVLGAFLALFGNRYVNTLSAVAVFILSIAIAVKFDVNIEGFQFVSQSFLGIKFGLDGTSLSFIVLTTFLVMLCTVVNWKGHSDFYIMTLEAILICFFSSLDLLSFFIFFEASLVPIFFMIGLWGSQNKIYATFKLIIYTLIGSVAFLISIAYIKINYGSTDLLFLYKVLPGMPLEHQMVLWAAFFLALAIKIPMWPVHTWLPDAHVEAPTTGSVMLAGVLIKMGGYGFFRLLLPLFPAASHYYSDFVIILSIIAIIYTSLVALVQKDMKKLVAYSSIAHMGFVTAGLFSFNEPGLNGAVFQMISHGLISSGLFLCVGFLYDRLHTRKIDSYGGLVNNMPFFSFTFIALSLASIGLPSTSGFIGELLSTMGVFMFSKSLGAFIATGIVLGSVYMLFLCKGVIWGTLKDSNASMKDLGLREILAIIPILVSVFIFGIYPKIIMDFSSKPINNLLAMLS